MTREDAIKIFNTVLCLGKCDCPKDEIEECLKMAIKALAQQPSEDEKVIRISKGTLKVRTGRYVIYDVEWLKTHFNTTEAKIYGQPSEDCISRKAVLDGLHRYFAEGFNEDRWWNSTYVLDAINKVPSATPQSKEEPQSKTGHWIKHKHNGKPYFKCSECLYFAPIGYSYCPGCGSYNGGAK